MFTLFCSRRSWLFNSVYWSALCAGLFGSMQLAYAQDRTSYPSKPVRLIVPSAPGSPPDIVARILGEKLTASLGQTVIVENRPGGVGTIGLTVVAKAPPDGYTLGLLDFAYIVAPSLVANMPYNLEKDLIAVSLVARQFHFIVVPSSSPAKSVADLIRAAKAKPGFLKFSSAGNGTPGHLMGELFKRETGADIVHIPYKGAPASAAAVLSGDVDMQFTNVSSAAPNISAGKIRALATAAARRLPNYPAIPTLTELGFTNVSISAWDGVVVPTGTSKEIVARLHSAIQNALAMPETKKRLETVGLEAADAPPEEFATLIRSESQKWNKVVRDAGIKAD
jgi:tripartite-type tricarboxylate transporter receptor subunit TctC